MSSSSNSLAAGTVTLTDSAVANCPISNLLPNGTAIACTVTATYAGSAAAYLAVNVLIETQAGGGGTRLYNPGDSANDLQVTITSSNPTVTYGVPTTATTCPGGAPSGSACYELDNDLVSTSAVTSAAVRPIDTPSPWAIGTSAVAIRELLIGLSAEPMNNGVVNRHENGCSGDGPISTGALIEDPEEDNQNLRSMVVTGARPDARSTARRRRGSRSLRW